MIITRRASYAKHDGQMRVAASLARTIVSSTHSGMGGAGDIAILSASNRMMLMPFARSPPASAAASRWR